VPVEIALIGAGTMGAGIAQLALEHGHPVRLIDLDLAARTLAQVTIEERLVRRLARRGLTGADLDGTLAETLGRLALGADPDEAAGAPVVIETIVEVLAAKQALFARLDEVTPGGTILATNTSALSVAAIAQAAARHPARVVGLHFFNPAPVMPLVEVIACPGTDPAVVAAVGALVASWGRTPIRSADRPGFVVNRINRAFTIQALRQLEGGQAGIARIDAAVRSAGFPLGPFELMDLVGIDVNLAAATGIWEGFGRAARFRPSPIQERLVAAGRLGRKAGQGFYRYDPVGGPLGPAPDFVSTADRDAPLPNVAIVERIRLAIVNEAFRALEEGVAPDEETIDLALRLGAGHPEGPFEWASERGRPEVLARLVSLAADDPDTFGPAASLRRSAETEPVR
jgi:3-hydroxybutyryl-CoA dehydrogenase